MHGMINCAIQRFVTDTYDETVWAEVCAKADLGFTSFESMLSYEPEQTYAVLRAAAEQLDRPEEAVLEDIGTYLVSHPKVEALRRLLRFGGVTFTEFLHSIDDLPDRARLAVADLVLPQMELREYATDQFSLTCTSPHRGFGNVMVGVLRAMADDYGALAFLEHRGGGTGVEVVDISVVESAFASGREFELGARAS